MSKERQKQMQDARKKAFAKKRRLRAGKKARSLGELCGIDENGHGVER